MTTLRQAAQQALEAMEAVKLGYLADVEAAIRRIKEPSQ